jgi:hypothetical protein
MKTLVKTVTVVAVTGMLLGAGPGTTAQAGDRDRATARNILTGLLVGPLVAPLVLLPPPPPVPVIERVVIAPPPPPVAVVERVVVVPPPPPVPVVVTQWSVTFSSGSCWEPRWFGCERYEVYSHHRDYGWDVHHRDYGWDAHHRGPDRHDFYSRDRREGPAHHGAAAPRDTVVYQSRWGGGMIAPAVATSPGHRQDGRSRHGGR